jgi:hypothetical protein
MFGFIKKLFGTSVESTPVPYKVESTASVVESAPAADVFPAPKKAAAKKKPAEKKPVAKITGGKPRGRKPKSK